MTRATRRKRVELQGRAVSARAVLAPQLCFAYQDRALPMAWRAIDSWRLARIARHVSKGEWSAVMPGQRWLEVPHSAPEGWGPSGFVRKSKLEQLRALKPDATLEVVHPRDAGRRPYLRAWWPSAAGGRAWVSFVLEYPPQGEVVWLSREVQRKIKRVVEPDAEDSAEVLEGDRAEAEVSS